MSPPDLWDSTSFVIVPIDRIGESEYLSANEATKEASWFCQVVLDVTGLNATLLSIKCDNEAAIAAVQRPQGHGRMKHIPIKMNLVREHVRTGQLKMEHVGTEDQLADILIIV
jgi:hypothetical protein